MNPIKRLWQWMRARLGGHQACKGHDMGRDNRSQGMPPLEGSAEDPRLRLLKSDSGPRIV